MISQDLLGWLTLLLIFLGALIISKKYPKTRNFLFIALFTRSLCVILDQYFLSLPDSTGDAIVFEHRAYFYSQEYGLNMFGIFLQQDSYFISKFISIFYTILDRSPMMAKMLSVGFGTGAVFLIYNLSFIIWGSKAALRAGWIAALFPSFILYSSIILREVYVIFFLTYALIGCVNYIDKSKLIYFIKALFGFLIASLFHGPIIFGFFIFTVYICFKILKQNNYFIRFKKKNLYLLIIIPIILLPIITYFLGFYSIPKLGNFKNFGNLSIKQEEGNKLVSFQERIIWKIKKATKSSGALTSGASYPQWTIPNNLIELVYLTPVRILYFLYSPFPWDIKRLVHFIGLLDAILYIYLSYCFIRNLKTLVYEPKTRFLILIFLLFVFIYSFGVGNFGTGIRHRLKFIGILIVIAAQKIPRLKLF